MSARLSVSVVFAAALALGVACAGRGGGRAVCPGSGWCGPADEAARMAEPAAGETLTCPIHVEASHAAAAGGLPAGVPAGAHGTLDERRTRKLRDEGSAATCCYAWIEPCPAG